VANSIQVFLLQNAEHPSFNAKIGFMLGQSTFVGCQKRLQASVCSTMSAHSTLSIETATQLAVSLLIVPARWRACVMRQCRDQHLPVGYIRY
jgi:hypothetical protein